MSTRGVIARPQGDDWAGRYHHTDSYPAGLGRALWHAYHGPFARDIARMQQVLLDEHPAGWSSVVDVDWTLAPGFTHTPRAQPHGPVCYCHGARQLVEAPQLIAGCDSACTTCGPLSLEWVYVLSAAGMTVLASRPSDPAARAYRHRLVGFIRWNQAEPDWAGCGA